jgi:hypothetical protein
MSYRIEIGPVDNPSLTLSSSDLYSVNPVRVPTAVGDFDAEIPYSRSIRQVQLEPLRIYSGSTLLFRGYLKEADWEQKRGRTRINGPGIGNDLDASAIERSFTRTSTFDAIEQVWANDTDFDATVYSPQTSVIVTDDVQVDASTTAELQAIVDALPADAPVVAKNGTLGAAQSLFIMKDDFASSAQLDSEATGEVQSLSEAQIALMGGSFGSSGDEVTGSFSLDYDIPDDHVRWFFRYIPYDNTDDDLNDDLPQLEVRVDGQELETFGDRWGALEDRGPEYFDGGKNTLTDLTAGDHTMSIVQTADSDDTYDEIGIDIFGVYDNRFSYNWDELVTNSGDGSDGTFNYLEGPELFPDAYKATVSSLEVDFNVVNIALTTGGWNNTTGQQAIAVSADDGATWDEVTNATSIDQPYPDNVGLTLDYRITFGRYGSGQERTPNQGYLGQSLSSVELAYDGSDLPVIQDDTLRGSPLKILRDLHKRASADFVIDHAATDTNGDLVKKVESFSKGQQTRAADWTVNDRKPRESFVGYANEVTIYGALQDDGTRPKVVVEDADEVDSFGTEPYWDTVPDLKTIDQVRQFAINTLRTKVAQRDLKGTVEVNATDILPGYAYPVDWFADGNPVDTALERVEWTASGQSMAGTLKFEKDDDVTATVIEQGFAIQSTRESI